MTRLRLLAIFPVKYPKTYCYIRLSGHTVFEINLKAFHYFGKK